MIESDDGMRFLLKSLQTLRIPGKAHRQKFERSLAARCHVGGEINFAHPATTYPFGNFVVTERLTDEQVSLPIFNNSRRDADSCGFDEAVCSLMRSEERFHFAAQNVIAFAGRIHESSNLLRLLIQRCVKDFLNRL